MRIQIRHFGSFTFSGCSMACLYAAHTYLVYDVSATKRSRFCSSCSPLRESIESSTNIYVRIQRLWKIIYYENHSCAFVSSFFGYPLLSPPKTPTPSVATFIFCSLSLAGVVWMRLRPAKWWRALRTHKLRSLQAGNFGFLKIWPRFGSKNQFSCCRFSASNVCVRRCLTGPPSYAKNKKWTKFLVSF